MTEDHHPVELTPAVIFDVLSKPRRRFVLAYLHQQRRSISMAELTRKVAAWEAECPVSELGEEDVDRVAESLYDEHLPKLAHTGLVTFERRAEMHMVTLTNRIEDIEADLDRELQLDPHEYHVD